MTSERLPRAFFARPPLVVARALLGHVLVRGLPDGQTLHGRVVETEAYGGEDDGANYFVGRRVTPHNAPLFGPPGHLHVHVIYRRHACLNISVGQAGAPTAVLVRAIEPLAGLDRMQAHRPLPSSDPRPRNLTNGPSKLCQALAIDRTLNGADGVGGDALWFEQGSPVPDGAVAQGPRVGLNPPDEAARRLPWRFWLRDNPWVSPAR